MNHIEKYKQGDYKNKKYNLTFSHSKKCFACGQERTRSNLVYFVGNMKTYCLDIEECKNRKEHPEFLKKIYTAPEYNTKLVPATRSKELLEEMSKIYSENARGSFFKLAGKSISLRLEPYQALYVAKLAQKFKTESIQETLRVMVEMTMQEDKYKLEHTDLTNTRLVKEEE